MKPDRALGNVSDGRLGQAVFTDEDAVILFMLGGAQLAFIEQLKPCLYQSLGHLGQFLEFIAGRARIGQFAVAWHAELAQDKNHFPEGKENPGRQHGHTQ
jgi:hypothetical protein